MWNKVVYRFEKRARQSQLSSLLPIIRERLPSLYGFILRFRDKLFSYQDMGATTRYQYRAIHRYFEVAKEKENIKIVLEVGTDLEGAVAHALADRGVGMYVGINPRLGSVTAQRVVSSDKRIFLLRGDGRCLPLANNSINSIISIATFEHINQIDSALAELYRALEPGGFVYADFGPIWSCSVGHHVYAKVGDEEARHWKPGKNPVPHFGHLLYSRDELRSHLDDWPSPQLTEEILDWIFDATDINRLHYEDYLKAFRESQFEIADFRKVNEHVDQRTLAELELRYPGYKEFSCRMIEVLLRKS